MELVSLHSIFFPLKRPTIPIRDLFLSTQQRGQGSPKELGSESRERSTFAPGPAMKLLCDSRQVDSPLRVLVSIPAQSQSLGLGRDQ